MTTPPLAVFASTDVAGVSTVLRPSSDRSGDSPATTLSGSATEAACVTETRLLDDPRRDRALPLPLPFDLAGDGAGGSGMVGDGRSLVHSVCGISTSGASGGSGRGWNVLGLSGAGGSRPRALRLAAAAIVAAERGAPASDCDSSGSTDSVAVVVDGATDGVTDGAFDGALRIVMTEDCGGRTGNDGCAGARKPCIGGGGIIIIGGGGGPSMGTIGRIGSPASVGHAFDAIEKPDAMDATDGER